MPAISEILYLVLFVFTIFHNNNNNNNNHFIYLFIIGTIKAKDLGLLLLLLSYSM